MPKNQGRQNNIVHTNLYKFSNKCKNYDVDVFSQSPKIFYTILHFTWTDKGPDILDY